MRFVIVPVTTYSFGDPNDVVALLKASVQNCGEVEISYVPKVTDDESKLEIFVVQCSDQGLPGTSTYVDHFISEKSAQEFIEWLLTTEVAETYFEGHCKELLVVAQKALSNANNNHLIFVGEMIGSTGINIPIIRGSRPAGKHYNKSEMARMSYSNRKLRIPAGEKEQTLEDMCLVSIHDLREGDIVVALDDCDGLKVGRLYEVKIDPELTGFERVYVETDTGVFRLYTQSMRDGYSNLRKIVRVEKSKTV